MGNNWDQGQHLHPDERFLTMVGTALEWPKSIEAYFETKTSPLNPHNKGYGFFVYGTLPLFLNKAVATAAGTDNYGQFNLTGRTLSAFYDTLTVLVVFLLGREFFKNKSQSLLAAALYGLSVLPIQQSHFATVETLLTFFTILTVYASIHYLKRPREYWLGIPAGIFLGLATASKISALLFFASLIFALILKNVFKTDKKYLVYDFIFLFLLIFSSFITFRIVNPYAFVGFAGLNPKFLDNLRELWHWSSPDGFYPPGVQWFNRTPFIFPLQNLVFWGLGPVFGFLAIFSTASLFIFSLIKKKASLVLLTAAVFAYLIYFSFQFTPTMRYFLPIYPLLAVATVHFLIILEQKTRRYNWLIVGSVLFSNLFWAASFVAIYNRPHSRVSASEWIYSRIPTGSVLTYEYWDDALPLSLKSKNSHQYNYSLEELHLYDPDTPEKWDELNRQLFRADYVILSSNRLYGSIPRVPDRYPITSRYYKKLFDGTLSFKLIHTESSFPTLKIGHLKFEINDDLSEEAFTVYDHPKVLIFQKIVSGNSVSF